MAFHSCIAHDISTIVTHQHELDQIKASIIGIHTVSTNIYMTGDTTLYDMFQLSFDISLLFYRYTSYDMPIIVIHEHQLDEMKASIVGIHIVSTYNDMPRDTTLYDRFQLSFDISLPLSLHNT